MASKSKEKKTEKLTFAQAVRSPAPKPPAAPVAVAAAAATEEPPDDPVTEFNDEGESQESEPEDETEKAAAAPETGAAHIAAAATGGGGGESGGSELRDFRSILQKQLLGEQLRSAYAELTESSEIKQLLYGPHGEFEHPPINVSDHTAAMMELEDFSTTTVLKLSNAVFELQGLVKEHSKIHTANAAKLLQKSKSPNSQPAANTTGDTIPPQLPTGGGAAAAEPEPIRNAGVGLLANTLEYNCTGEVSKKLTNALNFPEEPSEALLESVENILDAARSGDSVAYATAITQTFQHLNAQIKGNINSLGLISVTAAVHEGSIELATAVGGRIVAGEIKKRSTQPPISIPLLDKSWDEQAASYEVALTACKRGEAANMPTNFIDGNGARVINISANCMLSFHYRKKAQSLLAKTVRAVAERRLLHSSVAPKIRVLINETDANDGIDLYAFDESRADFNAYDVITSSIMPGLYKGNNALSALMRAEQDPFQNGDTQSLGNVLLSLTNDDSLAPNVMLSEFVKITMQLPKLNPRINYENLGLPIDRATGHYKFLNKNSLANLSVRFLTERFSGKDFGQAREHLTPAIAQRGMDGTLTYEEVKTLFDQMDTLRIHTTTERISGAPQPQSAFLAGNAAAKGDRAKADAAKTGGGGGGGHGKGGGGKGNKAGAAADPPRGRQADAIKPDARPRRASSLLPGEMDAAQIYARFVDMLGPKFKNLIPFAELLCKYFKATTGSECFVKEGGKLTVPLQLTAKFLWKAQSDKQLNWNVRRDIYAAWQLLSDLHSPKKKLCGLGKLYAEKHNGWTALTPDELKAAHVHGPSNLGLQKVQIRGKEVNELTN